MRYDSVIVGGGIAGLTAALPSVYQAGQWTYSPSGFTMSVITGKLAADKILKSNL